ncbi:hypothetical protein AcV5_006896 [Taiwanofungus camphoratus]|nr:hypothetical protein AcV5_006896 [Antrodia cinnamomea]
MSFVLASVQNGGASHMQFPNVGLRLLSCIVHLLGASILSFFLSRRLKLKGTRSLHGLSHINLPRLLVILTFLDSWLFIFTSGLLIQGVGMERNRTVCALGIYNCVAFYTTSKILIYMFLLEKLHVVWSLSPHSKRFSSPIYVTCLVIVLLYTVVAAVLIVEKISFFREDGSCVIGLKRPASITLLAYDLSINVLFTSLFLWPLYRSTFRSARVRRVAVRTVWAAAVALTTSCVNILVLTLMRGKQLGWLCLGSCGIDVVVNAVVLFWVTSGGSESQSRSPPLQEIHVQGENHTGMKDKAIRLRRTPVGVDSHQSSLINDVPSLPRDRRTASVSLTSHSPTKVSYEQYSGDLEAQTDKSTLDGGIIEDRASHTPDRIRWPFRGFGSFLGRSASDEELTREIQITVTTELDIVHDETFDDASFTINEPDDRPAEYDDTNMTSEKAHDVT